MFEDKHLRSKVLGVIEAQKEGKFVLVSYRGEIPGLPIRDDLGPRKPSVSYHDYEVADGYLDYSSSIGAYIFSPKPDKPLPKALENYQVLQLAEARLDEATRVMTIQTGEKVITFTGVEPWKSGYALLGETNQELTRLETGVVVWRIEVIEDPNASTRLFGRGTTAVSNDQVRLLATGWAFTHQYAMAYMNVVGYKTSIESLRATILQNKIVRLNGPENCANLFPYSKYEQVWQAMPEYTSHSSAFIAHQALPGKWTPEDIELIILVFAGGEGDPQAEIKRLLAARLNEALEIPIQPEWADAIWKAGRVNRYIQNMTTGGDCVLGVQVDLQADWNGLVQVLLEESSLLVS